MQSKSKFFPSEEKASFSNMWNTHLEDEIPEFENNGQQRQSHKPTKIYPTRWIIIKSQTERKRENEEQKDYPLTAVWLYNVDT